MCGRKYVVLNCFLTLKYQIEDFFAGLRSIPDDGDITAAGDAAHVTVASVEIISTENHLFQSSQTILQRQTRNVRLIFTLNQVLFEMKY